MLMIGNSPKGFPFRSKVIDDSLTIKFDLDLLVLKTVPDWAYRAVLRYIRCLLASYVCLLVNIQSY